MSNATSDNTSATRLRTGGRRRAELTGGAADEADAAAAGASAGRVPRFGSARIASAACHVAHGAAVSTSDTSSHMASSRVPIGSSLAGFFPAALDDFEGVFASDAAGATAVDATELASPALVAAVISDAHETLERPKLVGIYALPPSSGLDRPLRLSAAWSRHDKSSPRGHPYPPSPPCQSRSPPPRRPRSPTSCHQPPLGPRPAAAVAAAARAWRLDAGWLRLPACAYHASMHPCCHRR